MRSKRFLYGIASLTALAAIIASVFYLRRDRGPEVQVDPIERRDLLAVVSASGKIQPKRSVNISSDTIGRVTELAVEEGDRVSAGQFLLQIDPEALESAVAKGEAGLQAAREAVNEAKIAVETARANLELAEQTSERQRELYRDHLTPRESLDRSESEVKIRRTELEARLAEARAQDQRLQQEIANLRTARYNLRKVTIEAPIDGVITSLQIEEGETVLVGTMNNPGTVLMTIADLSLIQAELEVDETDVVDLRLGQAARVSVDASPDREFRGKVTKIGSSALTPATSFGSGGDDRKATSFAVEVTIEDRIPGVLPGFSCTAEITTAERKAAVAVPIQALTVREVQLNTEGQVMHEDEGADPRYDRGHSDFISARAKEEIEGVFALRGDRVFFTPVEVGIAGERYFEVLSGLQAGDRVVTGPYASIRDLKDGSIVRVKTPAPKTR